MNPPLCSQDRPRLAWVGPAQQELAWLRERLSQCCAESMTVAADTHGKVSECDRKILAQATRIVVAFAGRLEYAPRLLDALQFEFPEIPLAIATGTWWNGSGRTGIREHSWLSLPWHRWWDGWLPWLNGSASLMKPATPMHAYARTAAGSPMHAGAPSSVNTLSPTPLTAHIISGLVDQADAWAECSAAMQIESTYIRADRITNSSFSAPAGRQPALVIIDDSCWDNWQIGAVQQQAEETIRSTRSQYPHALLIVASNMPRWDAWCTWQAAGADELVSKPNVGPALLSLLKHASPGKRAS